MLILIILIVISISIIVLYYHKNVEGYAAKYSSVSIDDCANFCKTTENCYGFGYDLENKICYPSNEVIFGKPLYSIFRDDYDGDNFICNKEQYSTYLSLLLKNTLPEDDTAQQIIDSYNEKYIEQLENVSFIVNDNEQKQLLSQTIIDDSGLIELFGHELFYEIIDTDKKIYTVLR